MKHDFICMIFLADGKHASNTEFCDTASEAIERAAKWRAFGHIARAYLQVIDLKRLEVHYFPLD